ncbi:folate synthesis bifunctional protein-like [Calliopsis andreniformis]|uniref:folate synthesis bifunctional protein-like n=1 Tax=Calliopsis andreniformis TaxID=337506 RepID=UPI003FCED640
MIYISIGSNIGNRVSHLQRAAQLLKECYFKDLKSSIILETKAILPNGAPPEWHKSFLNMIVYGSCSSSPEELLKGLKQIECDIGRPQVYEKWAPRVIDLINRLFLLHLMAMLNPMDNTAIINKMFGTVAYDISNIQDCFLKSFTLLPELVDGDPYYDADHATKQALQLVSDSASIVDLGAQSTRLGSLIQTAKAEYACLKPVFDNLNQYMKVGDIKVSIDSFWPDVILNVLEHYNIAWDNIIPDDTSTINHWAERNINRLLTLGFNQCSIIIDPGIGFGKSLYQNIWLLRNIEALQSFDCKVLDETIALSPALHNKVDFLRVHNVRDHMQFFVAQAALQ